MNDIIDLSKDALKNEGNLWINSRTGQLRYSLAKTAPSKWIVPLSEYKVGNNGSTDPYIKCGQPVSIGLIEDLTPEAQISADPYIVPTNPSKYQWSIGIALEPGNAIADESKHIVNDIHILSHGQLEYSLNDNRGNLIFQPPNANGRYLWTYEDIGKPVYVSNHPDDNNGKPGGLTIDITHAYYNGANIVSVGRITDAPTATQTEQTITLEIQLAGDIRGMVDSTQFAVNLDKDQEKRVYTTDYDKLFFVKIRNKDDAPFGYIIYNDEIMVNTSSNTPIGCFVAKPKKAGSSNIVDTADWITDGKAVLVHRLGIITGNFNYPESDYGKELFLNGGEAVTAGPAGSYEYKVGLVIDSNHVLIDCRFPRILKKFDAVGTIKPAYMEVDTVNPPGKIIVDPGYLAIIEGEVHQVKEYEALIKATMYTGLYEFSLDGNNWREVDSKTDTYATFETGYFRFKDMIYQTADGKVISQIKFNQEGAPDDMQYLWPELEFDWIFTPQDEPQGYFGSSNIEFNIDYLVNLGAYSEEVIKNIEFYDIIVKIPQAVNTTQQGVTIEGDITVSPGFYTVIDSNGNMKWAGFEWAISKKGNSWFLKMITKPGAVEASQTGYITPTDVWGFCWPVGQPLQQSTAAKIYIRRRPIQHHALFLNQLLKDFPWAPFSDGRDLITEDTIHFGKHKEAGDIYSTEYHPRIQIRQEGPISGIIAGSGTQYYASHNIYYSPYFINNNTPRATLDQVIERRIPERVFNAQSPSDTKEYDTIEWIYNFKYKKVSLNADFAAHLNFPSTQMDQVDASGNVIKTIDYSGDYIEGRTNDNISGLYKTPRSALKTLHEIPVGFASYYAASGADTEANSKKLVTAQEQWNSGDTIERYLPNNVTRQIYEPIGGVPVSGTTYTYRKNDDQNDYLAEEWDHIKQEINLIFNPIKRVNDSDTNNLESGGDFQVIQSNVSLLNYAAKETQDRLLKIERAIFGIDAPTLPGDHEIESYVRNKLYSYSESLNDAGIIRIIKELYNNKLLEDTLHTSIGDGSSNIAISYFNDIFTEIFGDYESQNDWNAISGSLYNKNGKVHQIYIIYKEILNWELKDGMNTIFNESSFKDDLSSLVKVKPAITSARNIYLHKSHWGYQFDNSSLLPFFWPITGNQIALNAGATWSGPKPEDRWWDSYVMGTADFSSTTTNQRGTALEGGKYYSFSSQSVEGILYDLILKLSYIREECEPLTRSLKSSFTFINKLNIFSTTVNLNGSFKFGIPLNIFQNQGINLSTFFNNQYENNEIKGEYTAFGFKNDKISSAWHQNISPIYLPRNFSNKNYNSIEFFKYIANSDISNEEHLNNILAYLYSKKSLTKHDNSSDTTHPDNFITEEYWYNQLSDNLIFYLLNSSGWAFDRVAENDLDNAAADINTKIHSVISGVEFKIDDPGKHWYIITYIGKFMDNYFYEKSDYIDPIWTVSEYEPERITFPSYALPTLTIELIPSAHPTNVDRVTNVSSGSASFIKDITTTSGDFLRAGGGANVSGDAITSVGKTSDNAVTSVTQTTGTISVPNTEYELKYNFNPGTWYYGSWVQSKYTPENFISGYLTGVSGRLIDTLQSTFEGSGEGWTKGFISGNFIFSGLITQTYLSNFSGFYSGNTDSGLINNYNSLYLIPYNRYYYFSGIFGTSTEVSGNFETLDGIVSGLTSGWASGQIKGLDNSEYISGIYKPEKLEFFFKEYWEVDDYFIPNNVINQAEVWLKKYIVNTNPIEQNGLLSGKLNNNRILISGVSTRDKILDFHLFGAHIPENYIMLSKVRAQEHIVDQIHLTSKMGPFKYPKEPEKNNALDRVPYSNINGLFYIYWEPFNISNEYLIYQKVLLDPNDLNNYVWKLILKTSYNVVRIRKATTYKLDNVELLITYNFLYETDLDKISTITVSEENYLRSLQIYSYFTDIDFNSPPNPDIMFDFAGVNINTVDIT
jgi:hypothetical protein